MTASQLRDIDTGTGPARVQVTGFSDSAAGLLVLAPGASGQWEVPDLLAVRDAAAGDGWAVALLEPSYRVAGRKVPPRGDGPDRDFGTVVARLRQDLPGEVPVVTGGRSFGSRVACRTASSTGAVAVVCLAFPLHPPGRPERSRAADLDAVEVPVLVVQGERDPFGRPGPGPRREVVLVPGDHGLKRDLPAVTAAVRPFLARHAR